ncbi:ABC transporter ATP-binding protein [Sagittula salina]|uniref:ABC transporter ATP-binding protein n=1 Tax=Sagittula salina TaxID=2820268 RepID=A0A940MKS9_9RHOB|nr:ABC transporter ATP-binding protein [Sagittula salina]MBP0483640.1 ABC transporter ATP-binding protein [Sagittula salina]
MSLLLSEFTVNAGRLRLLDIPSLSLPSTGLVGVIGPNGAGKSTLLKALAGIIPHAGRKTLDCTWPDPTRIAYLPQDFAVSAAMSVAECVLLGRRERLGWRITAHDRAEVGRVLSLLDLTHLAEARMDRLSGGQQQRVLLAQRLLRDPRLMILDEPTSALDLHHQLEVLSRLKALSTDILVIAALHDLTLAGRFADHLVLIEHGMLKAADNPEAVLNGDMLDPVYAIRCEVFRDRARNPVVVAHSPCDPCPKSPIR